MLHILIIFLLLIIGVLISLGGLLWIKRQNHNKNFSSQETKYQIDQYLQKYLVTKKKEIKSNLKVLAQEKLAQAIEQYSFSVVQHNLVYTFELENDQKRGKLIGRAGRNIKTLETLLGVNLILDAKSNVVQISCFNPLRREIAKNVLLSLLSSGKINQSSIEKEIVIQKNKLDDVILQKGQEAVAKLKIVDFPQELIFTIGQLHFRTSYGQNTLLHSLEVATIAGHLAKKIGVDEMLAIKAGVLHDIGKAIDFNKQGDHISLGMQIVKKHLNNKVILDAIYSHHDETPQFVISWLVKAADKISAARIGARKNTEQDYIAKITKLEAVVNSFKNVKEAYALKGGREIRVLVNADVVSDKDCEVLSFEIQNFIEQNLTFPGALDIVVIREKKFITKAFQKK